MAATMDSPERLWRTQFDKQLTDKMMERIVKQTIALVRRVERMTPWRDQQSPDDRLHTAIIKTLDGTLRWDPARVDLERFFLGAIAGDISHELEHAARFRHDSLDDEAKNADVLERETSDAIADGRDVKDEVPKQLWWSKFVVELRKHANQDRGVLAIADAYEAGRFTKAEVMEFTGMSKQQYHAAYQRLMRVAQRIDEDVLDLIMRAIA